MRKKLWFIWAAMYILCAGLGFIPGFSGSLSTWMRNWLTVPAVVFFLPPALLLTGGDREAITRVRNIAIASLGLTAVTLAASFACSMAPEAVGVALQVVLILVSAPMVCGRYWVLSLFLWACLLMASLSALKKSKGGCEA